VDFFGDFTEVNAGIDFAHKKNLSSTSFIYRKFTLWQSGGLCFQIFSANIPAALVLYQLRFCGSEPAVKPQAK